MKRITFLKFLFLLFALIVGTSSAWAEDVKYTVSSRTAVTTSGTAPTGSSASFVNTYTSNKEQMTSGHSQTLSLSNYSGFKITQIKLSMKSNSSSGAGKLSYSIDNGTTWTYLVGSSTTGVAFDQAAWYGAWSTSYINITKSALNIVCESDNVIFKIESTKNSLYCQSYTITYQTYDVNQVVAPSITIPTSTPFVSSKTVTISSETSGASFYYTLNGEDPTTTTSETCFEYTAPFSINETSTIKSIAVKSGMSNSDISSFTFTKETVLDGISALNAATITTTETPHYVKLTDAQITYIETINDGLAFLDDVDAGIYLYTNNHFELNTNYNGIYRMTTRKYSGWIRVTAFEEIAGECSSEVTEAMNPIVMNANDLEGNFADYVSRQIKIVNYTLPNTNNQLTDNITLNNTYHDALIKGKTYTIIGYPTWYNTGKQFRVIEAYPKPESPTFDFADGNEFNAAFTMHLACETEGVTFYYTLDGTDPTTSSTLYVAEYGIAIPAATTTVKAIAVKDEMVSDVTSATYTYKAVAKPYFTPATGSEVFYGETVEIATATSGEVSIYYTTDGTDPTSASTPYTSPVVITDASTTLKAIAIKESDESSIGEASFIIKAPEPPTFNVDEGAVARNTVVTISSRAGTTIFYTTNGDDAESGTNANSNSVEVTINEGMTIKAIAKDPLTNISSEVSAEYTIAQVAKPTFSVAEGVVSKGTQLTITTATESATIYYTLDGTAPSVNSNVYNGYVTISKNETVKAIALKDNYIDSQIMEATYTVAGENEAIVFGDFGYESGSDLTTVSGTEITLTFAKNTGQNGPKYYTGNNGAPNTARIYDKNTLAINSPNKFTSIVFDIYEGTSNLALKSGEPGTLSSSIWSGDATNSVTFAASGTVKIVSVTIYYELTGDEATIGDSKLAGYCSEYALNFSSTGLKAYKAKVEGGNVVLTEIADGIVPAYEGVVLSGNADDYDIPFTDAAATTDFSDNEMIGITQRTLVPWSTGEKYNYILQQGEFRKATTPGGYLKPNRAYLSTSYNVTAVGGGDAKALTIVFNDATTGINGVEEIAPVTKTRKVVKNGRLVIETPNGEFTIDGAKVK